MTVSSCIEITEPSEGIKDYCKERLTIDNPDYVIAEKLGKHSARMPRKLSLYAKRGDALILPFGTLQDVWGIAHGCEYELRFHDFIGNSMEGNISLYGYQKSALRDLLNGKNGVLEAPCGSGKTQIGLQLIKESGGRALWLTHTRKLLEQSKERCEAYFKGDFGTITEGSVSIGKDVTFATVQTMRDIDPSIYRDAFDIVVVDECHHCVGSPTKAMQFYKVLTNCNCRRKYGLSATLSRSDGMMPSLFAIIGPVLHTIKKEEVGDKIIKSEHVPVPISLDYDPTLYLNADGTLDHNALISMLSSDGRRNAIIVGKVFDEYCKPNRRKQLVLCHRVAQAEALSEAIGRFCECRCVTGKVSERNRGYDGDVIVATYSLAKEGLDIPELGVLHLATPQKNQSTTAQAVGRIERNVVGKETPTCYDYVDEKIRYCAACFAIRKRILKKFK